MKALTGLFPDTRRDIAFPILGSLSLFVLLVGAGAVYQAAVGGSAQRVVTAMLIDAIMVIGIQVYIGNTGVLSFGHIGFGAIAGYAFAVFAINPSRKGSVIANAPFGLAKTEMGDLAALVLAVLVTLVAAVIIGLGLARSGARSGAVSATVITLGLLFGTHEVATSWTDLTGGNRVGLSFSIGESLEGRFAIYLALALAIIAARLFAQSRSGRLAAAAREDNLAARAMGANPLVQQMAALLLSVVIVSVSASLRVYDVGTILPDFFFFDYTLLTLVMLIVGGRNSVTGALLGVGLITAGRELARELGTEGFEFFGIGLDEAPLDWLFREGLPRVFLGSAMLAFMIFRPTGLLNDWELDEWLHARFGRGREQRPPAMVEIDDVAASHLSVTGVDVSFGGFKALEDAGIEVDRGEIVGIIGPNGAGKTTFVNVITGLVAPTAGAFDIDGVDLSHEPSFALARAGIVRTFQNLRLFGALTVRENVEVSAMLARYHRPEHVRPEIDSIVSEAGLWEHRHRRADELDYGNSRRLELARAAAMAPSFLLLDEPTSGMSDSESLDMVEQVRHMAATIGAGVIVIDHDLAFITGISDRIYVFDQGKVIAQGTPDEVQADPGVRAAYLGTAGG